MADSQSHSIDERLREKFESDWMNQCAGPIEHYIGEAGQPNYLATLEELIMIELEFAWKRTATADDQHDLPPKIHDYLVRFPQLTDRAMVLRLLQQEYLVRHQFGDRPSSQEYQDLYPTVITDPKEIETIVSESTSERQATDVKRLSPGQTLDRYHLNSIHGRGGFGNVWRASDPKLKREIAIKQLSGALAAKTRQRAKFAREAEITARLEHPGIVPVYDIGAIDESHPYYTMKLVHGQTFAESIKSYHDQHKQQSDSRVELIKLLNNYLSVCKTMQFAHSRTVIHRDLKPQNIIVGQFGETIILDWGLARMTDEHLPNEKGEIPADPLASSSSTRTGTIQGTPAYMSPEQALGDTKQVDERSDVYSLGAMMYQLLTGVLPFAGQTGEEMIQNVIRGEFTAPRDRDRNVPRALSAICNKAMATRHSDRYETVSHLTTEIENYLADAPVQAFREPWTTRTGRWMRHHKMLVSSASAAIVVALLSSMVALFMLNSAYLREHSSYLREQSANQLAQQNLDTAIDSVSFFLVDFTDNQALRAVGLEPFRQKMLGGARDFYQKLANQQEGESAKLVLRRAVARQKLGAIALEVGEIDEAIEEYAKSKQSLTELILREPANNEAKLLISDVFNDLGTVYTNRGDVENAVSSFHESIDGYESLLESDQKLAAIKGVLRARTNLGAAYENKGEFDKAHENNEQVIQQVSELVEQFEKDEQPSDQAALMRLLGSAYINQGTVLTRTRRPGQRQDAINSFKNSIDWAKKLVELFPDDPQNQNALGMAHSNLGMTYRAMMNRDKNALEKAKTEYEKAIEVQKRLVVTHPKTVDFHHKLAATYGNMSTIYYFQNDSKKSAEMVRHSIEIRQQDPLKTSTLPLHRYALAGDYFTHNNSLQLAKQYDKAIKVLKSAAEVLEPVVNLYPQDTRFQILLCKIYYGLGQATHGNSGPVNAIAWFSKSAETAAELKRKLPQDRAVEFILQHSYELRAICWNEIEETDKAIEDMELALANAAPKEKHRVAFDLAVAYAQSDQFDKALEIAEQMVADTEDVETVGIDERVTAVFTATRIYANSFAQQDMQSQTETTKLESSKWVERCLELLKIVESYGSLQTDAIKNVLLKGDEFESLRQRREFQDFLQILYGEH